MSKLIICKGCREEKVHVAKDLCSNCYHKQNLIICKECGEEKPHFAKRLCRSCFEKQDLRICKSCGEKKPHRARGLCRICHQKQNLIICKECGKLKPHNAKGMCKNCYDHKNGLHQPMHLNKSCTAYLSIMAEKLLSKVFSNVQKMPYGNKGFDFICSKGMKIDVKSSVLYFDKNSPNHKGRWSFKINKNSIPDYFLIIAFDSRKSLTPQHLWLIPSEIVNYLQTLSISKNQTHKYSQYELPLEKTLECCESMKGKTNDPK